MKKKAYPAKLPIQVMLPRPMYDMISRLARKLGHTRSGMIRELLQQLVPGFEAMEKSIDLMKLGDQEKARTLVDRYAGRVQADLSKERKQLRGKKR
jgi:predicted DNA-binding protein